MKKNILILHLLISLYITSCSEAFFSGALFEPKDYPYVVAEEIKTMSSEATMHAKILSYGKEKILDFGFIYIYDQKEYTLSLLNRTSIGKFTAKIPCSNPLILTCKAYVKTANYNVYSNEAHTDKYNTENWDTHTRHP